MLRTLSVFLWLIASTASASDITINETNGRVYYHLEHTLHQGEFTLTHPQEFYDPKHPDIKGACELGENGYFNLYISKDSFPVTAPNCNSKWLKVTMKGGDQAGLESKRKLWDQLQALQSGELDEAKVIIELNPYISIVNSDPLKLELHYCNVWFRTAYGKYVAHTESFKAQP
jgi:hypothetical protein